MGLFRVLFGRTKDDSPDVLGRYPEYMQVKALPERRYLKTSRLLALFIFLNMAAMRSCLSQVLNSVLRILAK